MKTKSAPSEVSALNSPAPTATGRKTTAQGNALGNASQNTSSPEGAKEGGKIPIVDVTETRVEQAGPRAREFTYVDIGSIDRETKRIVDPKVLPSSKAPSRAKQVLKTGDVLVSMTRPNLNAVALVQPDLDGAIGSTGFHVLRARDAEPGFLFYAVQSTEFIDAMCLKVQGALYPAVRPRDILSFGIPASSLAQQRQIVAQIEKHFTRLEAGVAALRRVQANLKRYRAAVLKAACEGRLVENEVRRAKAEGRSVETGEQLLKRILTERRQNWQGRGHYKEPAAPDGSNLSPLPGGWTWATIGACFAVIVGATPSRREASYWGGDIPWVSSGEVRFRPIVDTREAITRKGLENSSTKLNPKGTVLLGMIGEGKTRGQTAILKIAACNNQNSAAIWVSRTAVPPEFVYFWLWSQYDNTRRTSSGNNQPALNKARVEAMLIPLPPLTEQTRIVAEVERRLSVAEELESVVSANLQRAIRLRQAILQKAFAGELV